MEEHSKDKSLSVPIWPSSLSSSSPLHTTVWESQVVYSQWGPVDLNEPELMGNEIKAVKGTTNRKDKDTTVFSRTVVCYATCTVTFYKWALQRQAARGPEESASLTQPDQQPEDLCGASPSHLEPQTSWWEPRNLPSCVGGRGLKNNGFSVYAQERSEPPLSSQNKKTGEKNLLLFSDEDGKDARFIP